MATERNAPRFSQDPAGFDDFFGDVTELARRAGLSNSDTIKWAIRYAGSEGESWKHVPCYVNAPANGPGPTLAEFKEGVLKIYPQLSSDRRYTLGDLDLLVNRTQDYREMKRDDLGVYYRKFLTYSAYLIKQGRLSLREQSSLYLRGFPQPVRTSILQRLSIKHPDVLPDEGYQFETIHEAATFVLHSGHQNNGQGANANDTKPSDARLDDLIKTMANFTSKVDQVLSMSQRPPAPRFPQSSTPGGVAQNPPRWDSQRSQSCVFCSSRDHYVRDCNVAARYLTESKISRDEWGKIGLSNGDYLPRGAPGSNLKERIDSYWASEGIHGKDTDQVTTNFLEGPDESIFAINIETVDDYSGFEVDETEEQIHVLQAQLDAFREENRKKKRVQFDGVEIPRKSNFPPRKDAPAPPQESGPASILKRGPSGPPQTKPAQPSKQVPANSARPSPRDDSPNQHPQGPMRPVNMPPRPSADDAKFRYQAPVESSVKVDEIIERALNAQISISTRELLAIAPDVRRHVKDLVASKKVSANSVEVDPIDSFLNTCFEDEPVSTYFDAARYEPTPSTPNAPQSLPLRVIFPTFGAGVQPECILDGGAQIVVMRKDIWEKTNAPLVAKCMPMESANSGTTMTMGIIEDHPVQLGPITVRLQIHVVEEAPFEVLLGRPFFDVLSCAEISTTGGAHEIRVKDPKDGIPYVFPTKARPRKAARAVNFH